MSPELGDFLTEMATDPDKLATYIRDKESAINAANLSDADKDILRNNQFADAGGMMPNFVVFVINNGVKSTKPPQP